MNFKTKFPVTSVGSLPFRDEEKACSLIFSRFKEVPFWPQLPKRSFLENMYVQYSENLPGVSIDLEKKTIHVDTKNKEDEIEKVFKEYLEFNVDYFKISKDFASGFYEFLKLGKEFQGKNWQFVKGHLTGPISFGLTVTDENKRALYYNRTYKELLIKFLSMKAVWQVRMLKQLFDKVIIFIDEPYLISIGSSYVNINEKEVASDLNEISGAIHKEGAISGIHCCGNTNWGLLLKTELDIINFDAYNFIESVALYPEELKNFLNRGGALAFGLVPSQIDIAEKVKVSDLKNLFKKGLKALEAKGIPTKKLINSIIITPSCGLGSQEDEAVDKIFDILFELKENLESI